MLFFYFYGFKNELKKSTRLLLKNINQQPYERLGHQQGAKELKEHPFFHDIDWQKMKNKEYKPPFKPMVSSEIDTGNFDRVLF